jgi:hypothetical protein
MESHEFILAAETGYSADFSTVNAEPAQASPPEHTPAQP